MFDNVYCVRRILLLLLDLGNYFCDVASLKLIPHAVSGQYQPPIFLSHVEDLDVRLMINVSLLELFKWLFVILFSQVGVNRDTRHFKPVVAKAFSGTQDA